MSGSAFLAALSRMSARHMYSGNGTNFVGANRMQQEEFNQLQKYFSGSFMTEITEMGIEWHLTNLVGLVPVVYGSEQNAV